MNGKEDIYIHTHIYICIYIHTQTMKYFLSIRENEILPSMTTQTDLERTTLSETSQRNTNTAFHFYVKSKKQKQTTKQKQSQIQRTTRAQAMGEREKLGEGD